MGSFPAKESVIANDLNNFQTHFLQMDDKIASQVPIFTIFVYFSKNIKPFILYNIPFFFLSLFQMAKTRNSTNKIAEETVEILAKSGMCVCT